jgi:glycosyltransferase involved in cell wall biosynthesis
LGELPSPPYGNSSQSWTHESHRLPDTMSDGSPWPKISVVTPSFNQGQFIEETIRSVLLQGYPNLEYIVIDGCSTDNTLEIIKKYEPWLAYWVSEPDRGQSHAINKGIQRATGNILLWLNSDDICLPDAFCIVTQAFHADTSLRLVIGQAYQIDHQGQVISELRSQFTTWDEMVTNPRNSVRQISTFFSRSLFDELGLIDESLHIAMDTELLVRFTQFHIPFILDEFLTAYRTHANAKTYTQIIRGYEESDRTRVKFFHNKKLALAYHKRSAKNWLSLSESDSYGLLERFICLMHTIQNRPTILYSREFWFSLKKLGIKIIK